MSVISFRAARDYIECQQDETAACLILDLQLPDISGLELQKRLVDELSPPIIFISGRGDIPATVQAMKGGAIEFLTKPVDPEALLSAVRAEGGTAAGRQGSAEQAVRGSPRHHGSHLADSSQPDHEKDGCGLLRGPRPHGLEAGHPDRSAGRQRQMTRP
jgi:FixJ family two-component response regulator